MAEVNFYTMKDGKKCELCKKCLTMHMDMYDEDTYLWALEMADVPYIPVEWKKVREKEFDKALLKAQQAGAKDPQAAAYNMTKGNSVVFGKYLSKMKINQWRKYTWADTDSLRAKEKEDENNLGIGEEEMAEKLKNIKEAYEKGEISETQYMTYVGTSEVRQETSTEEKFLQGGDGESLTARLLAERAEEAKAATMAVPTFEDVDLPDLTADLTQEDKVYLALKWGRLYTPADWVALETTYKKYEESFDIHNADLEKGLIQLSKLDLKLNTALDSGDYESYSRLSRSYDALRKSMKFTEAQVKEEKAKDFDSIGSIVAFAEQCGGAIPEWTIDAPKDVIDTIIEDNRSYLRTLWHEDAHLAQEIEDFMARAEAARQRREDLEEAKAAGTVVEVDDEDYKKYLNQIHGEEEQDSKVIY